MRIATISAFEKQPFESNITASVIFLLALAIVSNEE